jgi:uncharacterized LabA/DUF88 family protein
MKNNKTIAYVDGYNLYHGIIDKRNVMPEGQSKFSEDRPWGNLLWLDLGNFIRSYKLPYTNLQKIKFFEAPSFKPDSLRRQQNYKNALLSLDTIDPDCFFGGEFKEHDVSCPHCCGTYTHHTEKQTDVSLAVEMLNDFYQKNCDSAIIVGGDTDQIPTIEKIKELDLQFKIYLITPPHRRPKELRRLVGFNNCRRVLYPRLKNFQLPDIVSVNGFDFHNPNPFT